MRIKLDENLPQRAAARLSAAGHTVDTVLDEGLGGRTDVEVVRAAALDDRLLITLDRGLGDIRAYPPGEHAGILVIRLDDQSPRSIAVVVDELAAIDLDALSRCVSVYDRGNLRVRRPVVED